MGRWMDEGIDGQLKRGMGERNNGGIGGWLDGGLD